MLIKMKHHWEIRQEEKMRSDVNTPPPSSIMSLPRASSPSPRNADDSSDDDEDLNDAWDRLRQALIASVPLLEEEQDKGWEEEYERYL